MMITVNLFDFNFSHDVCSVAGKTPRHITYVKNQTEWDGITLFTDGYAANDQAVNTVRGGIKIAWLHEPECLWPGNYARFFNPEHSSKFDLVLTYYQPLLDLGHPFTLAPYGGIWLPQSTWGVNPEAKTKHISFLLGAKRSTDGHLIRHEAAEFLGDRPGLIDYYGIRGTPVPYGWQTKDKVLSKYKFTIVSETCRQDNLFTEILLDCCVAGTIPLFYGCPNSERFFSDFGIWHFQTVEELAYYVNLIDEYPDDAYLSHLDGVRENFEAAIPYEITEDWLYENILRRL